jgi:hypothetical protein
MKAFQKCKTRKCSKYIKRKEKEDPIFEKAQALKCPQKSANAFYKCSTKFFNGSKMEKLMANIQTCARKECSLQSKKLQQYWDNFGN